MRSKPHSWTTLLTKLGYTRRNSASKANRGFKRKLRYEQCEDRRVLATYTVNVDFDATGPFDDSDNVVTLREAVFEANDNPGADTIRFSLPQAANGMVSLANGDLDIDDLGLTIDGTDIGTGNRVILDGQGNGLSPGFRFSGEDDPGAGEYEIRDLEITGFDVSPIIVNNLSDGDDVTFTNNVIHGNGGMQSRG